MFGILSDSISNAKTLLFLYLIYNKFKKSVTSVRVLNYMQLDKAQCTQCHNGSHVEGDEQHGGKG